MGVYGPVPSQVSVAANSVLYLVPGWHWIQCWHLDLPLAREVLGLPVSVPVATFPAAIRFGAYVPGSGFLVSFSVLTGTPSDIRGY